MAKSSKIVRAQQSSAQDFAFSAGLSAANAVFIAADAAEGTARVAVAQAAKAGKHAKAASKTTAECGESFWAGLSHGFAMNRALRVK